MYQKFYKKLFKNLDYKGTFYRHYDQVYKYNDLKQFYLKFLNIVSYLPNNRNKICVLSEKSFELYATSISTVLSNNIWIPISQTLPQHRIFEMIDIISPDLFIIDNLNTLKKIKIKNYLKKKKKNLITFEDIKNSIPIREIKLPEYKENDLSMIFFTSGSTGKPKGVKITQGSYIFSLLGQIKNIYKENKNLIFGDYHDISFVISLNILCVCFYVKGQISPGINTKDILFPIEHIHKNKVNTIITVPTTINRIRHYYKKLNKSFVLKFLIICGEPFYFDLLEYIFKKNYSENIFNAYGSTELSPWGFCYKCNIKDKDKFKDEIIVPIGKPFKKVITRIIDNEFFIGGPLLSDGYIDKTENSKAFRLINGKRFYKTNDIALKKKDIYFIKGRKDNVVKLFGYRIDLSEIDIHLRKNNKIMNCFIFVKEMSDNSTVICAAIESKKVSKLKIIDGLKKKLPNYMIPKEILIYDKFPTNKNNKMDRSIIKKDFD